MFVPKRIARRVLSSMPRRANSGALVSLANRTSKQLTAYTSCVASARRRGRRFAPSDARTFLSSSAVDDDRGELVERRSFRRGTTFHVARKDHLAAVTDARIPPSAWPFASGSASARPRYQN